MPPPPVQGASWLQQLQASFVQGQWQAVEAVCQQAEQAGTLAGNGHALHLLGMARWRLGQLPAALAALERAQELRPNMAALPGHRAVVLEDLGRFDEALQAYAQALALDPNDASIWANRGTLLKRLTRWREAVHDLQRACQLEPTQVAHFYNLAVVWQGMGELLAAQHVLKRALRLQPQHAEAQWNLALCTLLQGQWAAGWPAHEARWRKQGGQWSRPLQTPHPRWEGESGVRLLLWAEQGVGDEVFFASMLAQARKRVSALTVTCDGRLLPLMRRSFADIDFVDKAQIVPLEQYDRHLPVGSLGQLFRRHDSDFAVHRPPFLRPDAERVRIFRAQLHACAQQMVADQLAVVWVGVSWKSANPQSGAERSLALTDLVGALQAGAQAVAPSPRVPRVCLVNLQYGDVDAELQALQMSAGVQVLQLPGLDTKNDLDGLAALIQACDLVVSVQNATLHLAGAIGRPMWPLLRHVPDWRWQMHRTDSPWYPSAHLVRQPRPGDWRGALQVLAQRMQAWLWQCAKQEGIND